MVTVKISFHCNTSRHKHVWNSCCDTPSISSTSGYQTQVINIQREHDMTPTVDMVSMTHTGTKDTSVFVTNVKYQQSELIFSVLFSNSF